MGGGRTSEGLLFKLHILFPPLFQAIEFMSRVDLLHSHAVHFAIALHDMNLLYLTDSTQSKLSE